MIGKVPCHMVTTRMFNMSTGRLKMCSTLTLFSYSIRIEFASQAQSLLEISHTD